MFQLSRKALTKIRHDKMSGENQEPAEESKYVKKKLIYGKEKQ